MARASCALSPRLAGSGPVAGITGTPAEAASSRALTLLPSSRRVSVCGPMNTMPGARAAGGGIDHSRRGETMSRPRLLALLCLAVAIGPARASEPRPLAIAIHGGAGVIDPAKMTPAHAASYRAGLAAALDAGYAILERGGSSLDAVTAAVRTMEDDPQLDRKSV